MPEPLLTRRRLITAGATIASIGLLDSVAIEPRWLESSVHQVPIEGLPKVLEGLIIAQITDAHLTTLGSLEESTLRSLRQRRPQVVVLTGDLVDRSTHVGTLKTLTRSIVELGSSVVATLGNWEHWGKVGVEDLRLSYAAVGATLLVNEQKLVAGMRLFGTDDSTGGTPRMSAAPSSSHREPDVLLTHSPNFLDQHPPGMRAFDLALAGHTHGGQIRLGPAVAPITPPGSGRFVAGWYDTPSGRAYVSRGTGTSVVPARFTCRPELPFFKLVQG